MLVNISRKNSIILGLGVIALFFASGIIMLLSSNTPIAEKSSKKETDIPVKKEEKPDLTAPVTMSRFERHQIRDGKKLWEITAEKGRYIPLSNMAELENSKLLFYREDDSVIQLVSSNSKIMFAGTELNGAELFGGVEVVYNQKVTIRSDSATYNKAEDMIHVPGDVVIQSENIDLSGKDLLAYVSKHEVIIGKDVSTVIKPKTKGKAE